MKQQRGMLIKIWISIASIMLIPLLLLNLSSSVLMNAIREESSRGYEADLVQANMQLSDMVAEAETTIQLLSGNHDLMALALIESEQEFAVYNRIVKTKTIQEQLLFFDTFGYITSFYFANPDVFVSGNGICENGTKFYRTLYQYNNQTLRDLQDYADLYRDGKTILPYGTYLVGGKPYNGIAYLSRVSGLHNVLAITVLPQSTLDEILMQTTQGNGFSALLDRSGNPLYSYGTLDKTILECFDQEIYANDLRMHTNKQSNLMSQFSEQTGLYLVSCNPQAEVYRNSQRLNRVVWIFNIFCFFSVLLVTFILVRNQIKKMNATLQLLSFGENQKRESPFEQIDQMVSALVHDKHDLNRQISRQAETISEYFWGNLLHGYLNEQAQQHYMETHYVAVPSFAAFSLITILFQLPSEKDFAVDNIDQVSKDCDALYQNMLQDPVLTSMLCRPGVSQIAVICGLTAAEIPIQRERICKILAPYIAQLDQEGVITIIGKSVDNLQKISAKYAECQTIALAFHGEQDHIIWEEDTQIACNGMLEFPAELENRLVSGIVGGNYPVVKECLRHLIDKNFHDQSLTPVMRDFLKSRLKIVITQAYREEMPFKETQENILQQINRIEVDTLLISYVLRLFEEMCDCYKGLQKNPIDFKERVLRYIEAEYSNPNLSLTMISQHFSFSESHFSKMLKVMLEENFSTYLERIRMEHAERLLMETDLKIEEIAHKVAYYNVTSFRRAFKRYIGVSPTERRNR